MKQERKIIFTSKERKMLNEMIKKEYISEVEVAAKFKVHQTTVGRWRAGQATPPYSTRIMIVTMYEEYKNGINP